MALKKTATMASIIISVLQIIIYVLQKTATRTQLVIHASTITMWRPEIIGLSSQLIMWKMNSLTSGAELIVSRAELIVCEAKLTVSKAKTVMSEPHLILGVTNIISWHPCRAQAGIEGSRKILFSGGLQTFSRSGTEKGTHHRSNGF